MCGIEKMITWRICRIIRIDSLHYKNKITTEEYTTERERLEKEIFMLGLIIEE